MTILLTGGTGNLGGLVRPLLLDAGQSVRVLSRKPQPDPTYVVGDLATGAGIAAAVDGVQTIVHCAGTARGDEEKTRRLVDAARPAGVEHIVNISVVGADRVPVVSAVDRTLFGYFAMKLGTETIVAESGIPWTTLRASQFHELILTTVSALAKMPVVPTFAGVRFQPISSVEVAARMAELALGAPAGLVPEIAGPTVYPMADLVRTYLLSVGRRRPLLPVRLGGRAYRAIRAGANLGPAVGTGTWESFLATRSSDAVSRR